MRKRKHHSPIRNWILCLVLLGVLAWSPFVRVRQQYLNNALIAAIKCRDTPAVVSLLDAGADPDSRDLNEYDDTPGDSWQMFLDRFRGIDYARAYERPPALLVAVDWRIDRSLHTSPPQRVALVKALLNHGADVNGHDTGGTTPLMYAMYQDSMDAARVLLDRGAHINVQEINGSTPLGYAVSSENPAAVRLLLDRKADLNIPDGDGNKPLDLASNKQIQKMLLQAGARPK